MLSACAMKRQYTRNGWTPTVQLLCPPHLLEASMAPYEVAGEHSFCHWLYVKPETLKYHVEYLRSYEHKWGNNLILFRKIRESHNKLPAPPYLSSYPLFISISNHRCEWLRSFRSTRAVGDAHYFQNPEEVIPYPVSMILVCEIRITWRYDDSHWALKKSDA